MNLWIKILVHSSIFVILIIHIDDIVFTSNNNVDVNSPKREGSHKFKIRDLGNPQILSTIRD